MSNSALLTNPDRSNKVVCLTSHFNSLPLTQTIPSPRQPHSQTKKSRRRGVVLTEQGRQKLAQAGVLYDDFSHRYTYEELSERSLLDSRTVSRILSCEVKEVRIMNKKNLIHDRNARGKAQIGWLDSRHTFSFGNFYDPDRMGFRSLRVINEDRVAPGAGFSPHSHRDMEIISYVLEGELEHKDSLGNGSIIKPGDAQIMSAGTGITHSEFNPSQTDKVHFLQIWIIPDRTDIEPRYEQKNFPPEEKQGKLRLIAAPFGKDGAVTIHQDAYLYVSCLDTGEKIDYQVQRDRYAWLQIARGIAILNGEELRAGDGVQINSPELLKISTDVSTEILLFDLN